MSEKLDSATPPAPSTAREVDEDAVLHAAIEAGLIGIIGDHPSYEAKLLKFAALAAKPATDFCPECHLQASMPDREEMAIMGKKMANWLAGLSAAAGMPSSWSTTCAELAQAWNSVVGTTATDDSTNAQADRAHLMPPAAAPAGQHSDSLNSTQRFWLENRSKIIAAIQSEGLALMSNQHGFFLMKVGKAEAQIEATSAPVPRVGGDTKPDSGGGIAEVDVEAERRLFEVWYSDQPRPDLLARMDPTKAAFNAWLAARRQAGDAEPLAWESKTPVYTKFITDSRYQKLRPSYQKWYRPICQKCTATPGDAAQKGE